MLQVNPSNRATLTEILNNSWVNQCNGSDVSNGGGNGDESCANSNTLPSVCKTWQGDFDDEILDQMVQVGFCRLTVKTDLVAQKYWTLTYSTYCLWERAKKRRQ